MTHVRQLSAEGLFHAGEIRSGDPYELSNGHPIVCMPMGGRGSRSKVLGGSVLETDPAVDSAGVDTGFSPTPKMLRAPDVAVGDIPDTPGWVNGVPPLAVEYADTGEDENELQTRIQELLSAGTRFVWVVRLTGPRRVEIYEPQAEMRLVLPGHALTAPGVLKNPVPIEALYDREAAHEVMLRNLLERRGFESIEAMKEVRRKEGRAEGRLLEARSVICRLLTRRGLMITDAHAALINGCTDLNTLHRWHGEAAVASSTDEALR